jgi:hypothetical protein
LVREISDHNPIILDTMENREQRSREFRFDKRWIKDENFLLSVSRVWARPVRARDSLELFTMKLKNIKKDLKGWGANLRGQDIKKKKELSQELQNLENLEECGTLSREELFRKSQIQQELMQIYELEEEYWHQRGRENWLLKGDNNTEYFHRIANGHRRQRTIFSLQNGDEVIQGTPDLLNHATAFYKNLFGPQVSAVLV